MKFRFLPKRSAQFFRLNAAGDGFGRDGVRVHHGDAVDLSPDMADRVRVEFGPDCLVDGDKVVLDGDQSRALAAAKADAALWRLRAQALAAPAKQKAAAAAVLGAAKNAKPRDVVSTLLDGKPADVDGAVAKLSALGLSRDADTAAGASPNPDRALLAEIAERTLRARVLAVITRAAFEAHARRVQLAKALGGGDGDVKAFLVDVATRIAAGEPHYALTAEVVAGVDAVVAGWAAAEGDGQ